VSLLAELKRRNVFKVGAAYVVAAWLIIQFSDILLDNMGAPSWVLNAIMLVLAIGFVVTLFAAWAFELTPEGIKRESEVSREQSITGQTGKKLNHAIVVLLVLAVAYLLFDKFSAPEPASTATVSGAVETAESVQPDAGPVAEPQVSRRSIAVLPFDNRSPDANDAYFTDGIHDDLLTNLSRISALKVISRTSVNKYKGTQKTIPEIAAELGVANVMEGAVQRAGNQVRINVQLIDARTDEHLWAEIFDRELTANNLFAIQSEISEAIAEALAATLSPEEKQRINQMPTENLAAYEAYLKGRQLLVNRNSAELELATKEFEKAVDLDPGFALAWIGVADSYNLLGVYGTFPESEGLAIRKDAIDRALQIDDQLGEAYASLGSYFSATDQWPRAEESFIKAIELNPNYATAWHWYSNELKDFPLRIDESIEYAMKAVELDPSSPVIRSNLADSYEAKGLYSIAEQHFKRVADLDPEYVTSWSSLGAMYLFDMGRFADSLEFIDKAVTLDPGNLWNHMLAVTAYLNLGDFEAASAVRERMADIDPGFEAVAFADVMINALEFNAAGVRETINHALPKFKDAPWAPQFFGTLEYALGDPQRGLEIMLAAEPGWLDDKRWATLVSRFPTNACIASHLLITEGQADIGQPLLEQATRYLTVELPKVNEHADSFAPQFCHAAAGDAGNTLSAIETMLAHNHLIDWPIIHKPAMFDFVRDDPRFVAAMQEYERRIAAQREQLNAMNLETGP